mmetsp:Transcript_18624/g.44988  ORF Transcript_18624/g.44988 Transcript_18624/m.44988 type:complete len:783 (-) Transcript_18624:70-2418(-)
MRMTTTTTTTTKMVDGTEKISSGSAGDNSNGKYEIKIAVVGSGRCGKTSLLELLLHTDLGNLEDEDEEDLDQKSEMIHRYRITSSSSSRVGQFDTTETITSCGLKVKEYLIDPGLPCLPSMFRNVIDKHKNDNIDIDIVLEEIGGSCDIDKLTRYFEGGKKGSGERKKKTTTKSKSSSVPNNNNIDCLVFVADLLKETTMYNAYDEKVFELVDGFMSTLSTETTPTNNGVGGSWKVPLLIVGNKFDDPTNPALIERAQRIQQVLMNPNSSGNGSSEISNAATPDHRHQHQHGEEKKEHDDQFDLHFDPVTPAAPKNSIDPVLNTGFVAISCRRRAKATELYGDFVDEDSFGFDEDDDTYDERDHFIENNDPPLGQIQDWLYDNVLNENAMMKLLQRQHITTLNNLKPSDPKLVSKLRQIYNSPAVRSSSNHRHLLLNQDRHHQKILPSYHPIIDNNGTGTPTQTTTMTDPGSLMSHFWALYHACEDNALTRFNSRMEDVGVFERPLQHLKEYKILLEETKWEDPKVVVAGAISRLFLRQLNIIIEHNNCYSFGYWFQTMNDAMWRPSVAKEGRRAMIKSSRTASKYSRSSSISWKLLSPYDWATIYNSILVVAADRHFVENFGKQKMLLDRLVFKSHDLIYQQHDSAIIPPPSPSHSIGTETRIQIGHKQPSPQNRIHRLFRGRQKTIKDTKDLSGENHVRCDDSVSLYDPFMPADKCPSLSHALDGFYSLHRMGEFIPKYPETYGCVVNLETPQLPSDPNHFGHVAWTYCNMMREYYEDDE